jgi:hypothetical protein
MGRTGAPVVALCIAALLMLSACGAGGPAVLAGGATTPAASTTSGPAPEASVAAESVRIGPFTQVFATPLPASPAQAKVIAGFRNAQVLWDRSDRAWRLVAPVTDYVTGDALAHLLVGVAAGKQQDIVPAGTDRLFLTRVTRLTGQSATITTCDDAGKAGSANPRTGAVNTADFPPPDQAYLFETWHMVRLSGHWAIKSFSVAILPNPRARQCQP